ncbi:hypothetical protein WJX79_006279 [Trebouxia sp. C0005]
MITLRQLETLEQLNDRQDLLQEKQNNLLRGQASGMAADPLLYVVDASGMDLVEDGTELSAGPESAPSKLDQILNLLTQQQNPKAKAVSEVGSAEADSVLLQFGLLQEDGNDIDPIAVPARLSMGHSFDYSQFPSESDGNPALLDYHQQQLHTRTQIQETTRARSHNMLMSIQLLRVDAKGNP